MLLSSLPASSHLERYFLFNEKCSVLPGFTGALLVRARAPTRGDGRGVTSGSGSDTREIVDIGEDCAARGCVCTRSGECVSVAAVLIAKAVDEGRAVDEASAFCSVARGDCLPTDDEAGSAGAPAEAGPTILRRGLMLCATFGIVMALACSPKVITVESAVENNREEVPPRAGGLFEARASEAAVLVRGSIVGAILDGVPAPSDNVRAADGVALARFCSLLADALKGMSRPI